MIYFYLSILSDIVSLTDLSILNVISLVQYIFISQSGLRYRETTEKHRTARFGFVDSKFTLTVHGVPYQGFDHAGHSFHILIIEKSVYR